METAMAFRLDHDHGAVPRDLGAEAGAGNAAADDEYVEVYHSPAGYGFESRCVYLRRMINAGFTEILLTLLALILVVAAVIDVRTFTISNRVSIAVALLAPLYWWSAGLALWPDIATHVAAAAAVFALLALAFNFGMMGGGDVKLAAALALWFSPAGTLRFLVYMSIAGGLLTLVVIIVHRLRSKPGKPKVPYGVAIAIGALAILAQRFLNQFA
jgi:prepilin peptidase CpaA